MLGLLDEDQPIEIIYALHQGNGERLMKTIQTVAEKAGDWDELLAETAEKLHQIALMQLLAKMLRTKTIISVFWLNIFHRKTYNFSIK